MNAGPCRYEPSLVCHLQECGAFVAWQCEVCHVKIDYVKEKMKPEKAEIEEPKSRW